MGISTTIRRALGLAATGALVAALVGAAPVAASPGRAVPAKASTTVASDHARGTVTSRGRVNAMQASRLPVTRKVSPLTVLGVPKPAGTTRATKAPQLATDVRPSIVANAPIDIYDMYGLTMAQSGYYPAGSWVADNTSYVVQSVSGMVLVTNRSGDELMQISTRALFGILPFEYDGEAHVMWDATHGRWIGVDMGYGLDGSNHLSWSFLSVAVSDTADPRGSWQIMEYNYGFGSGSHLPDYPGLGLSSTSIVLSVNEYDYLMTTFLGASVLSLRWSDVLAGSTAVAKLTSPDSSMFTIRPTNPQGSTTSTVYLVGENASNGHVEFARLATPTSSIAWTDLTAAIGIPTPVSYAPVPPHQPGPDTITSAVDWRITDAVWHGNKLAYVTNMSYLGVDYVRIAVLDTSTTIPTVASNLALGPGSADAFGGGIGFTRAGALVAVYSQSSTSENIDAYTQQLPAPYTGWTASRKVASGLSSYGYERWGPYLGVATDLAGTDTVWVGSVLPESDHSWGTEIQRISVDQTAPTLTGLKQSLVTGSTLGALTVPVKVSWTSTDTGSGTRLALWTVNAWGEGFGATQLLWNATSFVRSESYKYSTNPVDGSYIYDIEMLDNTENPSVLAETKRTPVAFEQTSATYKGTWKTKTGGQYSGASTKYSASVGASATFKKTGSSFAFVTTKGSVYGKAKIYVDGALKTTLTLKSSTTKYRNLAYVITYATSGTHTIKIVVVSGRVDVDAFVVLQ
jgi:hypothetical protein